MAIGTVNSRDLAQEGEEQEDGMKVEGKEDGEGEEAEVPHARGPDLLGVEDMGLQNGKDVELSLGGHGGVARAAGGSNTEVQKSPEVKTEAVDSQHTETTTGTQQIEAKVENGDKDGDAVLVDADGTEQESGKDEKKAVGEDVKVEDETHIARADACA